MDVERHPDRQTAFQQALEKVREEEPLTEEELDALSVLVDSELATFRETWEKLPSGMRQRLLQSLRDAAEQRLRLDFSEINHLALQDPAEEVRLAAIEAGLEDRSDALLTLLLDMIERDPSPRVRVAAAEELARFVLLSELDDLDADSTRRVREMLLARAHDAAEIPMLRSSALASLGYFSDAQMADEIAAGFGDPALRNGAIRAMGRTADPRWTERLLPVLGSNDPDARREAANALAEIEDERAVGPLTEMVDEPEQDVRLAVIHALSAIGGDDAREALFYAVDDPDPVIGKAAEQALTDMEAEEEIGGFS
jgi:HEAT repeat protein